MTYVNIRLIIKTYALKKGLNSVSYSEAGHPGMLPDQGGLSEH